MQQPRGALSPVAATSRHAEQRDTQQRNLTCQSSCNHTPSIDSFARDEGYIALSQYRLPFPNTAVTVAPGLTIPTPQ
ncbi:unnamed protein product [Gadus morhua 'NCC']